VTDRLVFLPLGERDAGEEKGRRYIFLGKKGKKKGLLLSLPVGREGGEGLLPTQEGWGLSIGGGGKRGKRGSQ